MTNPIIRKVLKEVALESKQQKQIEMFKRIHKLNIRSVLFSSAGLVELTKIVNLHEQRSKKPFTPLILPSITRTSSNFNHAYNGSK